MIPHRFQQSNDLLLTRSSNSIITPRPLERWSTGTRRTTSAPESIESRKTGSQTADSSPRQLDWRNTASFLSSHRQQSVSMKDSSRTAHKRRTRSSSSKLVKGNATQGAAVQSSGIPVQPHVSSYQNPDDFFGWSLQRSDVSASNPQEYPEIASPRVSFYPFAAECNLIESALCRWQKQEDWSVELAEYYEKQIDSVVRHKDRNTTFQATSPSSSSSDSSDQSLSVNSSNMLHDYSDRSFDTSPSSPARSDTGLLHSEGEVLLGMGLYDTSSSTQPFLPRLSAGKGLLLEQNFQSSLTAADKSFDQTSNAAYDQSVSQVLQAAVYGAHYGQQGGYQAVSASAFAAVADGGAQWGAAYTNYQMNLAGRSFYFEDGEESDENGS